MVEYGSAKRVEIIVKKLIPGILGKTCFSQAEKRVQLKIQKEKALGLQEKSAGEKVKCDYSAEEIRAAFKEAFQCVGGEPAIMIMPEEYL